MSQLARSIAGSLEAASLVRRMFEEANRLRAQHGPDAVLDFSLGNPHLEPPPEFLDSLKRLVNDPAPGKHRYMPNPGFDDVRETIAKDVSRREGVAVPPDHVVMTVGAASALNIVFKSLLDPGDEVVLFAPIFPEYRFYVQHADGKCVLAETTDDFDIDPAKLEQAIGPRTRIVLINSPNNPTGRVYPAASIDALIETMERANKTRKRPIVLVSDEPYRRLVYDGASVPPLLSRYSASIIATSFSKDLGLAGERIGYLAVHPQFPAVEEALSGLIFCLRTLGFVNAPALMQRAVAASLDASVDIAAYKQNRDALFDGLTGIGYDVVKPEGAFFLFPRTPIPDDAEFCRRLREELVLAVPGSGFARAGHMRLSYAVEPEIIDRALPRFRKAFEAVG